MTQVLEGPTQRPAVSLNDKYEAESGQVLISGIEALVRLTLEQRRCDRGRRLNTSVFVSGYEGSPLGGVDMEFSRARRFLEAEGVVFRPGVNEELAATAVAGTQLLSQAPGRRFDGVVGFWYGKNPGLDRAADAMRHGNHAGTLALGGAVAWIGDDPTCKSSTLPSSCEEMTRGLSMPLMAPASIEDLLSLGLHAVALSRYSGLWVGLKVVADLADGAATIDLIDPASVVPSPDTSRVHETPVLLGAQSLRAEEQIAHFRLPRVTDYAREVGLNAISHDVTRPRLAIVAGGQAYSATLRALADLGIDSAARETLGLRLVKLDMPWPLDPEQVRASVSGVDEVLVIEDKAPVVESQIKDALYRQAHEPLVVGKTDEVGAPLVPRTGGVDSDQVTKVLARRLDSSALPAAAQRRLEQLVEREHIDVRAALPARTPYFCSGCPHNVSTRAADDHLVGMGIGCHTMVALDQTGRGHLLGLTQMGGEGAQWIGLSPFTDDPHYFQNLGDGTFFHSGSLALRATVASGVDITYKLLYNDAVAMTGGQRPEGQMSIPALTRWLALEGVRRVVVTTPEPKNYTHVELDPIATVRHRDDTRAVQEELRRTPGVSVLIHDDRCAAEERRLRKRGVLPTPAQRVFINSRVCEGCGDCAEVSSCLSVIPLDTEFGRKTQIHQGSCNQDFTCVKGNCPSFVLVTPKPKRRRANPPLPVDLPEPRLEHPDGEVLIRMPGIGGTGVVTTSRVLQMAAHLDGLSTESVEQTGLAQKGGPVISDVRIAKHPIDGAARAGTRSVDLLLGFDLLGTSSAGNLSVADAERTVAVISTATVPTAQMVKDNSVRYPNKPSITERIDERTRPRHNIFIDAEWIAERLSGEYLAGNMVLVGAAFQHGQLPLSAASIEEAIRLNGTAAEANLTAFRWGRAACVDPEAVRRALAPPPEPNRQLGRQASALMEAVGTFPPHLHELVGRRVADLIDYQDVRYARAYLDRVQVVASVEVQRSPASFPAITEAYARNLHKLCAYKDEYEVARLHLDPNEQARLEAEFGPGARPKVLLQPPLMSALGLRRKISLGPATRPAFKALRAARRLRGHWIDPFGHTGHRKNERALASTYEALVSRALQRLGEDTRAEVVALVELPDIVRGYDSVKEANLERFHARAADLLVSIERAERTPVCAP